MGARAQTMTQHYAIAIHGGAGVISRDTDPAQVQAYQDALAEALRRGQAILEGGGTSLDAVESTVRYLEDQPQFNAGRGAVFTEAGGHELDASIMDGKSLACGAVAGVKTVKNPITLARLVMERTPHILLAGEGAEAFAEEMGVERVGQDYFHTDRRYEQWQRARQRRTTMLDHSEVDATKMGTVGCVALDKHGNLAAATSTGGMTNKKAGRVGDSPLIGAGNYAENATCAVSGTGIGEEFIRHGVAQRVAAAMRYKGLSLEAAAGHVVREVLKPGDGGVIAVDGSGNIAMVFNTQGMFRGAADSRGQFEVGIWE